MMVDVQPYALMSELLDSLHVGVCLFDESDRTLLWNRSFLKLFPEHDGHVHVGEAYADNLRRFYLFRLNEDELPLIDRYIQEGVQRHRTQSQPFIFQHRGQWLRVASSPLPGIGRVRIWTPLTSPTGALSWGLQDSAADGPPDRVMDNVADGIMALDTEGRISSTNEQVLFLYDIPRKADIVGLRYDELLRKIGLEESSGLTAILTERQRFAGAPFEVRLPSGRWIRVAEQRGVDGTAYSTHVDITEMKRLQSELNRAKDEADKANAAKSRFLAMISHEIRTPMNAIIGLARIALKTVREPGQRLYLEKISSSASLLLGVINDLLDFSKIEAGRMDIASQTFRLADVLDPLFDTALAHQEKRDVRTVLRIAPEVPCRLTGDPLRLGQILSNLVGNALKFTDRGEVNLSVATIGRTAQSATLEFCVSDTGIGIEQSQLSKLFEPFVQAEGISARRHGGTGLGLAICRQLVSLMGGTLSVDSTPGRGSRFSFALTFAVPQEDAAADAIASASPASPAPEAKPSDWPRLAGRRILLVEDNALNREVALHLLHERGIAVDVAVNGLEAVRLAALNRYDMVLMDIQMPVMDGLEATRLIRRLPDYGTLPILAMTAQAMEEQRLLCLEAGVNDLVTKPIDPQTMFSTMDRHLAGGPDSALPSETPPPVTLSLDRALERLDGDRTVLDRMLALFSRDSAGYPKELRSAAATGDTQRIKAIAHILRASADYIGAAEVAKLARSVDLAVATGNAGQLAELVPALADRLQEVLCRLDEPRDRQSAGRPASTPASTAADMTFS